jgi:hypothetical protein
MDAICSYQPYAIFTVFWSTLALKCIQWLFTDPLSAHRVGGCKIIWFWLDPDIKMLAVASHRPAFSSQG